MKDVICTLLEGHYHLGFAVLANSLISNGYDGEFHVGYRGALPPWATLTNQKQLEPVSVWPVPETKQNVYFHSLETDAHLTNFKPDFMLQVLEFSKSDSIFFFDPDIVVKCPWSFLQRWINYGVALCEDVNSPLNLTHPRRLDWSAYFKPYNRKLSYSYPEYANGGFIGLQAGQREFLETWQAVQNEMAEDIGGLGKSMFSFKSEDQSKSGPTYMFSKSDQDALNVAVAASPETPFTFVGRDAMDFEPGGFMFAHALGGQKPWIKDSLKAALRGSPPTPTDKIFWEHADGPIKVFSDKEINKRRRRLKIAQAIGRFYRRG